MRVFSSNQSVVPGRWFSRRMRSEICGLNARLPTEGRRVEQPERARSAPAPVTPFSISRRLIPRRFGCRCFMRLLSEAPAHAIAQTGLGRELVDRIDEWKMTDV